MDDWRAIKARSEGAKTKGVLGIVAKYGALKDAYKSLSEALTHASLMEGVNLQIKWIDPEEIESRGVDACSKGLQGILVPGALACGHEGILSAVTYARVHKVPFLGICAGMQFAVIEAARTQDNLKDAHSEEFTNEGTLVVRQMKAWEKEGALEKRSASDDLGGSMRLGAYPCI